MIFDIEILNISDVTSLSPAKDNFDINEKQNKNLKQKKFSASENTEIQKMQIQEKPKLKKEIKNNNIEILKKEISIKEKKINKIQTEKILTKEIISKVVHLVEKKASEIRNKQ